ncbi:CCA-adding enzyme [uncultured archaeon]|nr:CCA-adding enzyme [uncultured archaeon]
MKINEILKEVGKRINPSEEELKFINKFLKNFIELVEKKFNQSKINAELFIGGSFAKKTLIKKGQYDIDIFVRFDSKYKEKDISKLTEKAIKSAKIGKISTIHGSRDYFRINVSPLFFVEVIPVIKVKNTKDAGNITDLSYFHVGYIRKKFGEEKMLEEVRLAKAFCHATNCYGAEGYIQGFSGYALELLVLHYKGFFNFVKAMTKIRDKEIIDIEKLYKNKQEIEMNLNDAKRNSPIILIDPTYKERNALAALSKETFEKFQDICKKFVKSPSEKFFEDKKIDVGKIKENAKKNNYEFLLLEAKTNKQEGDIAGSKLIKFYRHLSSEINKLYELKQNEFEYNGKKEAKYVFVVKKRNEIIISGPHSSDKKNVEMFKKKHRDVFTKGDRVYAREKITKKINEFVNVWKVKNKEKIKEMGITELRIALS